MLENVVQDVSSLEELESIRAYDSAKSANDEAIPFEQAVEKIAFAKGAIA